MNMNFGSGNEAPRRRAGSSSLDSSSIKRETNKSPAETNDTLQLVGSDRVQPNLIGDNTIGPTDVLCGRGKLSFNHVGNRRFRDLVATSVESYNEASSRMEKANVVNSIVEEIRASGGKFLRRDDRTATWHPLNFAQCKEKVGHAIRDAHTSIEARKKRKLQQEVARSNIVNAIFNKNPPPLASAKFGQLGLPIIFDGMGNCTVSSSPTKPTNSTLKSNIESVVQQHSESGLSEQKLSSQQDQSQAPPLQEKLLVMDGKDVMDAPTAYLQEIQKQDEKLMLEQLTSSKVQEQDHDHITATDMWRCAATASIEGVSAALRVSSTEGALAKQTSAAEPSSARTSFTTTSTNTTATTTTGSSEATESKDGKDTDEQFLAYIEDALGPLPEDAAKMDQAFLLS